MREGWREVKLSELVDNHIVELKRGKIIAKTLLSDDKEYPVYSASAQGNGLLGYSDTYDLDEELISWSVDGGGRPFYREKHKFSVTNVCGYLRILDTSVLDYRFLYYCMRSEWQKNKFDYSHKAHPSVIKELYNILIPPLDEQKKIAKVLSDLENLENIHSAKADVISRMKEHLMDNKSGIIEKERNRSNIDSRILELSSKLGLKFNDINTKIKIHKESLDKINYRIEVITYVGENTQYERERESLTPGTPWVTSKLGDLCTIKTGKLAAKAAVENGNYPFFTANTSKNCMTDTYSYDTEAVLMSKDGEYAGFVRYYNGKFNVSNHSFVLTDFKGVDVKYIKYYLQNIYKQIRLIASGGAIPGISMTAIQSLNVAYPQDIEEQKKIANILSDLDELANLHSLKVNELTKMKESLMNNKSGIVEGKKNKQESNEWITVSLKDICNFTKGKNPQEYNEDGLGKPIVSAPEIGSILGNCTYSKFTDEDLPDCVKDDILLLWDGSRAGISGFNHEAILSSTIMRLRVKDKDSFYPKLIYYMLVVNKDKISSNRTGSAIPHLNRQVVEDLIFELPRNIEEQKRIADILSQYDKMIDTQEELISIIQRERESLYIKLLR